MSENICEFCSSNFLNKYTLLKHQSTAKFCLEIQNKNNQTSFECETCFKLFNRRDVLDRHIKSCKDIIKNNNEKLEKENIRLKEKISKLKENLKVLEVYKKLYDELKEKYEKQQDNIEKLASKAIENAGNKTINNTTNNKNRIVQNLIPLTDEYMLAQRQYLTYQTVKNGIEGIAEFASNHTFKDRVFCSDVSRLNFIFKSENGEVIKDPEGVELTKKFIDINKEELIRLLEEYLNQILDKLYAEDTDEVEYKIYAKRREEIIATRLAIKKGNIADNTESYNTFKRNFLYALSGLVPR